MSAFTTKDFATLLDEAIAEAEAQEAPAYSRTTIPFDVLAEGQGGEPVSDAAAAAEYLFAMADAPPVAPLAPPAPLPDLPSTEPAAIARELKLTGREKPETLDRLRREFAFRNHPDRVAPELRQRAIVRMQIANRMIDDAKWRLSRA